jgi:hypothetical protein
MGVFLLTLVVGNFALPREKRLTGATVGHDFLAFYTAGAFLNQGRGRELYDLEAVKAFQHELAQREGLEIGPSFGPFWNPPFYAHVFRPYAALRYPAALVAWEVTNVVCLIGAIALLISLVRPAGWVSWALIPLLLCTSMPFIQAMTHGQNTMVSLLLLCGTVSFWRGGRPVAAGLVGGLLFYKPQLGAVIAVALVLTQGWRAVMGLAATGAWLLIVNVLTLPGTLEDYLARMPDNLRQFQVVQPYLWDRHVTLRAFWRLLLQGREAGEMGKLATGCWLGSCGILALVLGVAWRKTRRRSSLTTERQDSLIIATVCAMPLLMPFYFDYDLLLVGTAAVLFAFTRTGEERWLTGLWIALYAWLMVNSMVARVTGVNGTVMLLAAITFFCARRVGRPPAVVAGHPQKPVSRPLATAA